MGRAAELSLLAKRLGRVERTGEAVAVTIRGRRQVGKSRLAQEFCDRAGVPYLYFAATKGASPVEAVSELLAELASSTLPAEPALVPAAGTGSWPDAFRALAATLPARPAVVVLDELPWLAEQDDLFDGALQTAWDRLLRHRPVLLLLLGSDVHMMDRLTAYDRPFFGRADSLVLGPLRVFDIRTALGLDAADAIDAHLVSGGLPGIVRAWPPGTTALAFMEQECADPGSPLFGVPESALLAEFAAPDQTRRVLEAIGGGDRTHATIAAAAGGRAGPVASGSLSPILRRLVEDKRVLQVDTPLSTRPGRPAVYHVADSNLRLYLAVLRASRELAERGRPDAAFELVQKRWTSWRGRAVEPVVRDALLRAAAAGTLPWAGVTAVGGWWNRRFDPEIDLVGADRAPVARELAFTGSIKWLGTPFDRHDLVGHLAGAAQVPGHGPATGMVVVSRAGVSNGLDLPPGTLVWGPADVTG